MKEEEDEKIDKNKPSKIREQEIIKIIQIIQIILIGIRLIK